jgi:hypothetical protein
MSDDAVGGSTVPLDGSSAPGAFVSMRYWSRPKSSSTN